jgi:hypothetical protein
MSGRDIPDPRSIPSMLEAGVSGLARSRDWDVVVAVEMPSLRDSALTRVSFYVLAPDEVEVIGTDGEPGASSDVIELLARHATASLAPPLEARAVRTADELWSVAARRTNRRPTDAELPPGIRTISVARAPDGELTVHVNGELTVEPPARVTDVVEQIVAVAEREQEAFVATLEQFDSGRVALAIDPL